MHVQEDLVGSHHHHIAAGEEDSLAEGDSRLHSYR